MYLSPETILFIREHRNDDVHSLALQAKRYPQVDMPLAIVQIAGWQATVSKIPSWHATEGLLYPRHLSLEQCSSEVTALYKASLVHGEGLVDLTGGFGIDCAFLATQFKTDTAPLIDKYRNESATYPDACHQDMNGQLAWLDSVLTVAKEDWVIVAGHHPIYAETPKDQSERSDLQSRLDPILRKHKVDMYICGHIHNFQHIRVPGSDIDYIVNSAGSLARKVKPIEGTQFCSPEPGFSVCSIDKQELNLRMIDKKGNILYTVTRKK